VRYRGRKVANPTRQRFVKDNRQRAKLLSVIERRVLAPRGQRQELEATLQGALDRVGGAWGNLPLRRAVLMAGPRFFLSSNWPGWTSVATGQFAESPKKFRCHDGVPKSHLTKRDQQNR
jgi:hypothetical protein